MSSRDLDNRTILVTGASTGIGRATVLALARRGARIWMACRDVDEGSRVAETIRRETAAELAVLPLDLADLRSVRACAASFLERATRLDVLVNNAGIAWRRGGATAQGSELFFGVNYLGHFLLTKLLFPAMPPGARIVNVASRAHYAARAIDWDALRRPTRHPLGRPEYCVAKLCNVLHAKEIARRHPELRSYSLHPGVVASDIWRGLPRPLRWLVVLRWRASGPVITPEAGAQTTLYCAASDSVENESGLYYEDCRVRAPSALASDPVLSRELWEWSERHTA